MTISKQIELNATLKQLRLRKGILEHIINFGKGDNTVVSCNIENLNISEEENITIDFFYLKVALLSELNAINKAIKHLKNFKNI